MDLETLADLAQHHLSQATGPDRGFREKHLALLKKEGLKAGDPEYYRFTNLESFFKELPKDSGHTTLLDDHHFAHIPCVLFVDGRLEQRQIKLEGVSIEKLEGFPHERFPDVREDNALRHLHHALLSDQVQITVEKNAQLVTPIRIQYVSTKNTVTAPTVVVIAGANSRATVIEEHLSLAEAPGLVAESYLHLENGARLEHIQIANGKEGLEHTTTTAEVQRDGNLRSFVFHLGGKLNRRNVDIHLRGPGSHAESFNLFLTGGKEHSDISTRIEHFVADSTSEQLTKGILDDVSRGVFTGLIHIHPDAQRVNSGQLSKTLLLSKKAQAHSQPQLEIFADDVKCSHGSTTGQLSPEELFYFQARGIPDARARILLAQGFALEVVQKIKNKSACEAISKLIHEKLKTKFKLGVEA